MGRRSFAMPTGPRTLSGWRRLCVECPKISGGDPVERRRAVRFRRSTLPRHLQEGARVSRGEVSQIRPSTFAAKRDLVYQLLWREQKVVETVPFGDRIRHPLAAVHQFVEELGTLVSESDKQADDRIPCVGRF